MVGYSGQLLSHKLEVPREVRDIAEKSAPINVIVHYPKTIEGQRELAERVADVHASLVNQHIKKLNCPSDQKAQLLDAVIKSASTSGTCHWQLPTDAKAIEKAGKQTP